MPPAPSPVSASATATPQARARPRPRPAPPGRAGAGALVADRQFARDLATAARAGGFALFFQPRVTLDGRQPVAAEAVLRWPHRRHGLIRAAEFLPLAARIGTLDDIAFWLLTEACREAAQWPAPLRVAVNILPTQMQGEALLRGIGRALERSGLPAERLELELPEAPPLTDDAEALLALAALRDLGVGITLDEFGAANAGLTALRHLPLSALKLDRSLVRDLPGSADDAGLVRAIATATAALGLDLAADGIQVEAQRAFLADAGCRQGQGHLFCGLLDRDQARAWFASASSSVAPST